VISNGALRRDATQKELPFYVGYICNPSALEKNVVAAT
jgi:hypothetical protein